MTNILKIEKNPKRNLLAFEWVILGYAALTLLAVLFCFTSFHDPVGMILLRVKLAMTVLVMCGLYRMMPCRLMMLSRYIVQVCLLGEWYPDTYQLNCILPNQDPGFAVWDQAICGFQPALLFSEKMPWLIVSESMYLGYWSYYLLLAIVPILYFIYQYEEFTKTAFIVIASFFVYYFIYDLLPVTGPQYYYHAVGLENIAAGVFPDVGTHFYSCTESLPLPGGDGLFKSLVQSAHDIGERPTAAFPSSHVGASTVILCLAVRYCMKQRSWLTLYWYVPLYVLLCLATVYIQAHYLVDALAGIVTGLTFFLLFYNININQWEK